MLVKRINFEQLGEHCYDEIRQVTNTNGGSLSIADFDIAMKRVAPCNFRVLQWTENDDLEPGEFIIAIVAFDSIDDWIFFKMRTDL
jgi:hypothetical protein